MDIASIKAILSGIPAGGRKEQAPKPVFKSDAQMEICLTALTRLNKPPSTGHRRLELTSSQLPPIF